jgi:uncharacterized protein (DUF3084 family)
MWQAAAHTSPQESGFAQTDAHVGTGSMHAVRTSAAPSKGLHGSADAAETWQAHLSQMRSHANRPIHVSSRSTTSTASPSPQPTVRRSRPQ